MYPDRMHITRVFSEIGARNHPELYETLVDNRYTDGEWPRHGNIQTVADLRRVGLSGLKQLNEKIPEQKINSFLVAIGIKRKAGRPRRKAA